MAHIRNIEKILQVEPPIPRELPNSYVFFHMCINCALFPWAASNLSLSPYKHSLWLILGMIPNATLRLLRRICLFPNFTKLYKFKQVVR